MNTIEEFDAMICKFDADECVRFFSGMNEKERKAFSERAELWHDLCVAHRETGMWSGSMGWLNSNDLPKRAQSQLALLKKVDNKEISIPKKYQEAECLVIVELAMTACSNLTELKKLGVRKPEEAFKIMKERKPKWIEKWLNHACDVAPHDCWHLTRQFEREEGIQLEHGDGYWLGMAIDLGQMQPDELASFILERPEYKNDMFWKMIENERAVRGLTDPTSTTRPLVRWGGGGGPEQWQILSILAEKNRRASYLWKMAIAEMAKRDEQIKMRMLDIIFHWLARLAADNESKSSSGLTGEFAPTHWFQTLHDDIEFTAQQKSANANSYLSLLSLKDTSTLNWAIEKMSEFDAGSVAIEDVLHSLSRVFYHKRKDPASAALKFLDKLYQSNKNDAVQLALAAVEGLEHPSVEVQKKVLSFLKKTKQLNNSQVLSSLEERQHLLSGLLRQELNDILQQDKAQEYSRNEPSDITEQPRRSPAPSNSDPIIENNIVPFRKKSKAEAACSSDNGVVSEKTISESSVGSHEKSSSESFGRIETKNCSSSAQTVQKSESSPQEKSKDSSDFLEEFSEIRRDAEGLKQAYVRLAGIDVALKSIEAGESIAANFLIESNEVPRLDPSKRIAPVESLDDLIYLYLHVLEDTASTDDVERLVDGVARLNHIRPLDFESRVSALRKKAANTAESFTRIPRAIQPFGGFSYRMDLEALALAWMDAKAPKTDGGFLKSVLKAFGASDDLSFLPDYIATTLNASLGRAIPLSFFAERLKGILRLINKRISLPLLAAPTHIGGWIDPKVIPNRLAAWQAADMPLLPTDVIQMLLRLAPEGRKSVSLPAATDESLRAIRYAFTGEISGSLKTPELWIAAFRSRDQFGDSDLFNQTFPGLGPDSAIGAKYSDSMEKFAKREDRIFVFNQQAEDLLPLQVSPAVVSRANLRFFPIELIHDRTGFFDGNDIVEYYYLQNREPYLAYLGRRMALFMDSQGEYWKSSWNCVFDPDVSLHKIGTWVLLFGLSAKQADEARLALDACIAAIEENRVDPVLFGQKMEKALGTGRITLSRWINAFKEIMRISPLHLDFVHRACESCIAELPLQTASKPPIPLLELLYDTSLNTGYIIKNLKARNYLEKIEGKGKAAKLAKLLCDLREEKSQKHLNEVNLLTLRARIDRAKRWQSWTDAHAEKEASTIS